MTAKQVLAELKAAGKEKTQAIYRRHGAETSFGASSADIETLRKQIKRDDALAEELWATGYYEARTLAAMIADPQAFSASSLDRWAATIGNRCDAETFARYVAGKSPHAMKKAEEWTASAKEALSATGYAVLAVAAMNETESADPVWSKWLEKIEAKIHAAPNRTRHSMNSALIAIGLRNPQLQELAIAAAKRIGKVEVDHGDTACETPDAIAYIKKAAARKKPAKRSAKSA